MQVQNAPHAMLGKGLQILQTFLDLFGVQALACAKRGLPSGHTGVNLKWALWMDMWVKMKPPGIGPQVLVLGSIYQGFVLGTYF